MKTRTILLCFLLSASAHGVLAHEVAIPSAPAPDRPDTESATNAVLPRATMRRARTLRTVLSLHATPSNNVEIAFGASDRADGSLPPGDEELAFGWENGAWFLASPTNRLRAVHSDLAETRTLVFDLRVEDDGTPTGLSIRDDAGPVPFPSFSERLPAWLFSRDWNVVRLTVRGTDPRDETLAVRLDADGSLLLLR